MAPRRGCRAGRSPLDRLHISQTLLGHVRWVTGFGAGIARIYAASALLESFGQAGRGTTRGAGGRRGRGRDRGPFWARSILVGLASTIWSVAGVALIPAIGWGLLGRKLGGSAHRGRRLTVAGAVGLNLSSKTAARGRARAILLDTRWVCRQHIWSEYCVRADEGGCPLRSLVRLPKHSTGIVGTGN